MKTSPSVKYDFSGKIAIVTGAAGGFGHAIAKRLHDSGASIALWDTNLEGARTLAETLGKTVLAQAVNITDENAVNAASIAILERFGQIDMLINNAGILGPVANTWEHTTAQFQRVIDVNLVGTFICCRVVVPHMLKNPMSDWRGRIVNVASIQGKEGMPQAVAYAASKAGIMALSKSLGKELAAEGILVNVITPAAVMTAMLEEITEERKQSILARIPMNRFLTSEEVAAQIMWLCSPDCSFATGAVFDLSGGRATY